MSHCNLREKQIQIHSINEKMIIIITAYNYDKN